MEHGNCVIYIYVLIAIQQLIVSYYFHNAKVLINTVLHVLS